MSDPFMPDWRKAPPWATHSAVDADGEMFFYDTKPVRVRGKVWWFYGDRADGSEADRSKEAGRVDMTGLDWRKSVRSRPNLETNNGHADCD